MSVSSRPTNSASIEMKTARQTPPEKIANRFASKAPWTFPTMRGGPARPAMGAGCSGAIDTKVCANSITESCQKYDEHLLAVPIKSIWSFVLGRRFEGHKTCNKDHRKKLLLDLSPLS